MPDEPLLREKAREAIRSGKLPTTVPTVRFRGRWRRARTSGTVWAYEPHERATSVWYRVAGLLRRKDLAIDIIEAEIRSAQHEVWLEAAKLVLTDNQPIAIARHLRELVERTIRPK